MGVPVVQGDVGGPYVYPSTPPAYGSFQMVSGSTKTFISGKSVMLVGQAQTTGGAIITSTTVSAATFVEGRAVHLVGSLTSLSTGWRAGILQGGGAANTQIG